MQKRYIKLPAVILAVLFAMGLFALPMGASAEETVYNNIVPNPSFEDESPLPIPGSNLADYGRHDNGVNFQNGIKLSERAKGTPETREQFVRVYTYDTRYAYKAKFLGPDGSIYNGGNITGGAPLTNGNYFEIPIPGLSIVKGTKYGVSFRCINDPAANEGSTEAVLYARLNWNTNPNLGENVAFNQTYLNSVNKDYGWKKPGLTTSTSSRQMTIIPHANAVVNDTTKLQIFFGKIDRTEVDGVWGEHTKRARTMYFDDFYIAPISTAAGVDIPPAVIGSTPADGAEVADPVDKVTVRFNYKVDMASLTPDNIQVTGATIAENGIVMAPDAMSVDINFAEPVSSGFVAVTLKGGAGGINDVFSRSRTISNTAITFSVGSVPPILFSTTPENGATGVLQDTSVRLTFSKALDPNTVNTTNITTADATIDQITLENEGKDIVITFAGLLDSNKLHTITLANIKGADGSMIEEPITLTFTTAGEPVLEQVWPADGEKRVYIRPTVNIKSNVPIKPNSWEGKIKVNGDTTLIRTIAPDTKDPTRLSIVLNDLHPFTDYTVTIDDLESTLGVPITGRTITFTTGELKTNIFPNEGFEYPKGYDPGRQGFDTMKNTIVSESAYQGAYSIKVTTEGGEDWIYFPKGTFSLGKKYGYSYYAKIADDSPKTEGSPNFKIQPYFLLSTGSKVSVSETVLTSVPMTKGDDYKRVSGTFIIPYHPTDANATLDQVVCKILASGAPYFYIDNLEIYELTENIEVTSEGTLYEGAIFNEPPSEMVIAFNRDMDPSSMTTANVKIDGVAVASVTPDDYSARRFIITPAEPLSNGVHTIEITNANDVYDAFYNPNNTEDISIYSGSFTFMVRGEKRYEYTSFKIYANGSESNVIVPSATMKASVVGLENKTEEQGVPHLFVALFKDDEMVRLAVNKVAIGAGQTASAALEAEISLSDINLSDGTYVFRAFLWEDLLKRLPIATLSVGE